MVLILLVSLASIGKEGGLRVRWTGNCCCWSRCEVAPFHAHAQSSCLNYEEFERISEEDANLQDLVLDRSWRWMHHVRDGVTQFLYKFLGSTNPSHFSQSQCELPASCSHHHIWKETGLNPTVLSLCYGAGGFTDLSPRVETTSSLRPVDSPARDSVMWLLWEAVNFEWHFVIEVALSPHFFSFMNIDEWAVSSFWKSISCQWANKTFLFFASFVFRACIIY